MSLHFLLSRVSPTCSKVQQDDATCDERVLPSIDTIKTTANSNIKIKIKF